MTANDSNMQERGLSWQCGQTTTCSGAFNNVASRRCCPRVDVERWASQGNDRWVVSSKVAL